MIKRDIYLNRLIDRMGNGSIKVVTGIRRCGKSVLLFDLFGEYLSQSGVSDDHIIKFAFDSEDYLKLIDENPIDLAMSGNKVDPHKFTEYIQGRITDDGKYYLLLDEVQQLGAFESVLNGFLYKKNLDVYVTGSNSKFLSSDVITEFRGRGDEVRVYPLSFREYYSAVGGDKYEAWDEYHIYGGMPALLERKTDEQKAEYLQSLMSTVYLTDIVERNKVEYKDELESMVDFLCSAIGSLTNPKKISDTLKSIKGKSISSVTAKNYLLYLTDAFLFSEAKRFDVKGKKYFDTPLKYYISDVGLRNARLSFRQIEENHIMENVIYNELRVRGYSVDVGIVESHETVDGTHKRKLLEIDFVANKGNKKYYVQSAFELPTANKLHQETRPLLKVNDSFKKIVVVKDNIRPRLDENGIMTIGLINFLLDENSLDL
ncbi:MAG: ATP-binding protein [Clostridiales bacterium]|nr:ATP-binding protein [Clostridiales bacterium]